MLGTDKGVTIKTRFDESVAMGAAWHVGAEGLELKTMILSCNLGGWSMRLVSSGEFLSRD
jgi:hypothetical protein